MDNGEAAVVALAVGDDTNTAHVATAGHHGNGTGVELDKVGDLAGGEVNLDGVVDLDRGVGVADAGFTMLAKMRRRDLPLHSSEKDDGSFGERGSNSTTRRH